MALTIPMIEDLIIKGLCYIDYNQISLGIQPIELDAGKDRSHVQGWRQEFSKGADSLNGGRRYI